MMQLIDIDNLTITSIEAKQEIGFDVNDIGRIKLRPIERINVKIEINGFSKSITVKDDEIVKDMLEKIRELVLVELSKQL